MFSGGSNALTPSFLYVYKVVDPLLKKSLAEITVY